MRTGGAGTAQGRRDVRSQRPGTGKSQQFPCCDGQFGRRRSIECFSYIDVLSAIGFSTMPKPSELVRCSGLVPSTVIVGWQKVIPESGSRFCDTTGSVIVINPCGPWMPWYSKDWTATLLRRQRRHDLAIERRQRSRSESGACQFAGQSRPHMAKLHGTTASEKYSIGCLNR